MRKTIKTPKVNNFPKAPATETLGAVKPQKLNEID